jgi:hypothetical protein
MEKSLFICFSSVVFELAACLVVCNVGQAKKQTSKETVLIAVT